MLENILNFLPILLPVSFISLIIAYEDFKTGLIKNQYIVALLLGGLAYHLFTGQMFIIPLQVVKIFLLGLAVSFGFYFIGIWPAGDAKLFLVYILLLPHTMYNINLVMTLALNTFVPIFFVLSIYVLVNSRKRIVEALKYSLEPYRLLLLAVILLGIAGITMRFLEMSGIHVDFFIAMFILFLAFELFYSVLSLKSELVFFLLAVLRIIFDRQRVMTQEFVFESLMLIGIFVFFRFFLLYLIYYFYTKETDIEDLEEGMSPAEGIVEENDSYHKVSFLNVSFIDYMEQKKNNFIHNIIFLTEKDVEKIKNLYEKGKLGLKTLRTDRKQYFALIIWIGYLLTVALRTDVIHWVSTLI